MPETLSETTTPTRAQEISRYVELSALGNVLANIAAETELVENVNVCDAEGDSSEAFDALWPPDGTDGFEEVAEFHLAQAESCARSARIFAWLASAAGREFCAIWAARLAGCAESSAKRARELAGAGEGGDGV